MKRKKDSLYDFYKQLDRRMFVDKDQQSYAKYDHALPIGYGQTISQPSLVYEMVKELDLTKHHKVLEIGTGSGYQTAFLAEFSKQVFTIEFILELQEKAKQRLDSLGYKNITYRIGDGSLGWKEYAPYERMIVSCAASKVPTQLIEQLSTNGIMVIPIGAQSHQMLMKIKKNSKGEISKHNICPVRFVEFVGQYGWNDK